MQAFNDSSHIHRRNGKAALCTPYRRVGGGMEVRFHLFLTSALDVVTGQRYVPATLGRCPLTRRLGGPNIRSERLGHTCISVPARN